MFINNIGSECTILAKLFYDFLVEIEQSKYYGNPVSTDISIDSYIQYLTNKTHQQIINVCYRMFKNMKWFLYNTNNYKNNTTNYMY